MKGPVAREIGQWRRFTRDVQIFDSEALKVKAMVSGLIGEKGEPWGAVWGYPVKGERKHLAEWIVLVRDEILRLGHRAEFSISRKHPYQSMIGKSQKMQEIFALLEKISASESSVFIQGASGTGKELVAQAIHYCSLRKNNIFFAVNCSAFNDNLLDSELFGHVRGAFTEAVQNKKGLFEQADGGTLFLDEVGDTSPSMQVKLLRVLQEGTYLPVGSDSPRQCNVRIIASTNRPIEKMMREGQFREDFYYRLSVININLPSLHERMEDVPLLVDHFMEKKCREMGLAIKRLSPETMEKILSYSWPGNVRELENELERLIVLAGQNKVISSPMLASRIVDSTVREGVGELEGKLKNAIEKLERQMIQEGLVRCSYNKSHLARELGISRANLIAKVHKYGLEPHRVKETA